MTQTHPTDADLRDFVLGKLRARESDAVEKHLSVCPACLDRAATEPATDTLLELLAGAATRANSLLSTPCGDALTATHLGPQTPPAVTSLAPPAELTDHPKYRLLRPLGVGGMGTVWLAEHLVMGRQVAVKVIRAEWANRPGAAERFHREVRATARLTHPNIAVAFDAEQVGERHLLVMEYVPGDTLAAVVGRGPLPVGEACRAVRDAARGLAHAHAAGLTHRDVKPSNLIRTPDGVTKLLDFGLATAADPDAASLTGANVVMGTPDYIAPEQAADPRAADARSDIYALGCTLYHLLSERVPYPADSVMKKIDAHRDPAVQPAPLDVPPELAAVVAKMMAKNPADRYQTADEMAAALANAECGVRSAEQNTLPSVSRSAFRIPRWAVAAGLLFALLGLAVAGVVYKVKRDNEELTIATDDPDIEVVMKRNGELVRIVDTKTKQAWELDTKKLRLKPDSGELAIDLPEKGPLVIRRNGDVAVTIRREPKAEAKPPATARVINLDLGKKAPELKLARKTAWQNRHTFFSAFSPDGKFYGATGEVGLVREGAGVRVWETATGKEVLNVPGCGWLAFSPDSRQFVTYTSNDNAARVWDLATKKPVSVFVGHKKPLTSAVLSADGKRLVTASEDRTIRVWDTATSRELRQIKSGVEGSSPFIASAGGKTVLAYDYHQKETALRVYDTESGEVQRSWECRGQKLLTGARVSADGKRFVTFHPTLIRLWDVDRDEPVQELSVREGLAAHAASADLNWLLFTIGVDSTTLYLVRASSGEVCGTFKLPKAAISNHDISTDGKYAVISSVGTHSEVYLLELPPAKASERADPPAVEELHRIPFVWAGWHDFSADGKEFMAYTSKNGKRQAVFFETAIGKETGRFPVPAGSNVGVWFIPGSQDLLVSVDHKVSRWDRKTSEKLQDLMTLPPPKEDGTFVMPLSGDGKTLCVAMWGTFGPRQGGVFVYDLATGKERFHVKPLAKSTILGMFPRLSPDGKRLVTTDTTPASSTIRIWDTATGELVKTIDLTGALSAAVEFSPDGKEVVAVYGVGGDTVFGRWEVASGERVGKPVLAPSEPGGSSFFFPGGGWLGIHPPGARSLRYYDTRTGEVMGVYEAGEKVLSIAASADGRFALYVTDGSLRVVRNPTPAPKRK